MALRRWTKVGMTLIEGNNEIFRLNRRTEVAVVRVEEHRKKFRRLFDRICIFLHRWTKVV
jgi:hypothetical protein